MASSYNYDWTKEAPSAYEIHTAWFPYEDTNGEGVKLRPCLVLNVWKGKSSGLYKVRIAYGTRKLKLIERPQDLVVQNSRDLDDIGLPCATRFDLDQVADVIWSEENFGCWPDAVSPYVGSLTEEYIKNYLWLMAMRQRRRQVLANAERGDA